MFLEETVALRATPRWGHDLWAPHLIQVRLDYQGPPGTVTFLFRNVRVALLIRPSCPFTRSCSQGWTNLGTGSQYMALLERNQSQVCALASCSGGPEINLRPEVVYLDLRIFLVLISLSRQIPGSCLKLGHDHFHTIFNLLFTNRTTIRYCTA
jgi:hypothetical protein